MAKKKKKKVKRRKRPACGLCGSTTNLTKTECCDQWICDDEDQYVAFSYARNSCYRNHHRQTLCGYHYAEEHEGDWKDCKQCREDFSDDLEIYVDLGTNEYNFEKLANPPAFEPTYCGKCGERIVMANGGYSVKGDVYTCSKCDGGLALPLGFPAGLEFDKDEDGLLYDEDGELLYDEDLFDDDSDEDVPCRYGVEDFDDLQEDMLGRFDDISVQISKFCELHDGAVSLAITCMDMVLSLCIQFPELVKKGKTASWAGGIVHAIASVNFLPDPSFSPHITLSDIDSFFEVSKGTIQSKSKQIRDLFNMLPMDPEWTLPELLMENPILWTVPIDGLMIDIRTAPPETQQRALDLELIPMLPAAMEQYVSEYYEMIKSCAKDYADRKDADNDEHKPNIKISDYRK